MDLSLKSANPIKFPYVEGRGHGDFEKVEI